MAKTKDITRVQDRILDQFKKDAYSSNINSAVAQAVKAGQLRASQERPKPADEPKFSPRFLVFKC